MLCFFCNNLYKKLLFLAEQKKRLNILRIIMNLIEKIFETNVINLTFVIVILISVVGNALTQSLSNRRETILMNLAEADKKANEAQEKLRLAKVDFEVAKDKASQLKKQNQEQAENEKKKLLSLTECDSLIRNLEYQL